MNRIGFLMQGKTLGVNTLRVGSRVRGEDGHRAVGRQFKVGHKLTQTNRNFGPLLARKAEVFSFRFSPYDFPRFPGHRPAFVDFKD